jgi:hypothetical protein
MSGRGKGKTAKKSVSQSSKAGLQFPVGRVAVRTLLTCTALLVSVILIVSHVLYFLFMLSTARKHLTYFRVLTTLPVVLDML